MKIQSVQVNLKKQCIEISTVTGNYTLPFARLPLAPTPENPIDSIEADAELANEAITYRIRSGEEETIHLDAFLDYNRDFDFMHNLHLYNLTLQATELLNRSGLSKREVARKLKTSPAQLYRLLDTANYSKTIDQMLKLLHGIGSQVEIIVTDGGVLAERITTKLKAKFRYLDKQELEQTPAKSKFRPLLLPEAA